MQLIPQCSVGVPRRTFIVLIPQSPFQHLLSATVELQPLLRPPHPPNLREKISSSTYSSFILLLTLQLWSILKIHEGSQFASQLPPHRTLQLTALDSRDK
ncbi:hypothetical protein V9T40_001034 [Parthenolecanium corni]|uniref:Uncharacterized protein n=1 Tax=Parthenolecanium corni TaxID=536013 RepID=A0AAN9Y276_9HEMI